MKRRVKTMIGSKNCDDPVIDYKNIEFCGVAKFLEEAANSKVQLFI